MKKIRIILADDHQIIRDGLKSVFAKEASMEIVHEVANGLELLDVLDKQTCDVLLLDISMPHLNGLDALRQIKSSNSNIKVLVLTMHDEPDYIRQAAQNGADGYLLKNADHFEILQAVKMLNEGKKYFNNIVSGILVDSINNSAKIDKNDVQLTSREKEVLRLVANGLSNKLIADELNISPRTVETHRNNLIKKFQVFNTAELIKKAFENKLI